MGDSIARGRTALRFVTCRFTWPKWRLCEMVDGDEEVGLQHFLCSNRDRAFLGCRYGVVGVSERSA